MALRGRPRSFDREVALNKVMKVFWAKGYECAQINDFTAAIGITPPSFYAAFGSKEQAFREAVGSYMATIGAVHLDALETEPNLYHAVHSMLKISAEKNFACPAGGCMISVSSLQCKAENQQVKDFLTAIRHAGYQRIFSRFSSAQDQGELGADTDITQLADFYHAVLQAISYAARDGSSAQTVQNIIEMAMLALPARPLTSG